MSIVGLLEGEVFFIDKTGLCKFIGSTCLTACICSLLTISSVGINRYIFIVKNNIYRKLFTRRSCYLLCVILWVISFLLNMPNFVGWGGHTFDRKTLSCIYDRMADPSFTLFFAGFIVSLPVIVTSFCYIRIYLFWRKVSVKIAKMSKSSQSTQLNSMKLARMLFLLFFIYVICWTPYAIVANADRHNTYSEIVHIFSVTSAHLNSSINPILYGVTNLQFRSAYIRLLRKMFCLKKAEKGSGNLTETNHVF
uniref:GCR038 n=1 Tax=Schmidtea mediterranea TaxID=79327 RepID=A0A193KUI0_SCHMD|nr:GCR038 [Schmidtea mediterranea]